MEQSGIIWRIKYYALISEFLQVQVAIQPVDGLMPKHDKEGLSD